MTSCFEFAQLCRLMGENLSVSRQISRILNYHVFCIAQYKIKSAEFIAGPSRGKWSWHAAFSRWWIGNQKPDQFTKQNLIWTIWCAYTMGYLVSPQNENEMKSDILGKQLPN